MKKSKIFMLLGVLFLVIALIMYVNAPDFVYNVTGPDSIALSGLYVRHLFVTFFIGQVGAILLILGIRDHKQE